MATPLSIVRRAIEIQGYITIHTDAGPEKVTAIKGVDKDGSWITDRMSHDLRGWIRIKKTKKSVIAQAERIITQEPEIRAAREASEQQAANRMQWS